MQNTAWLLCAAICIGWIFWIWRVRRILSEEVTYLLIRLMLERFKRPDDSRLRNEINLIIDDWTLRVARFAAPFRPRKWVANLLWVVANCATVNAQAQGIDEGQVVQVNTRTLRPYLTKAKRASEKKGTRSGKNGGSSTAALLLTIGVAAVLLFTSCSSRSTDLVAISGKASDPTTGELVLSPGLWEMRVESGHQREDKTRRSYVRLGFQPKVKLLSQGWIWGEYRADVLESPLTTRTIPVPVELKVEVKERTTVSWALLDYYNLPVRASLLITVKPTDRHPETIYQERSVATIQFEAVTWGNMPKETDEIRGGCTIYPDGFTIFISRPLRGSLHERLKNEEVVLGWTNFPPTTPVTEPAPQERPFPTLKIIGGVVVAIILVVATQYLRERNFRRRVIGFDLAVEKPFRRKEHGERFQLSPIGITQARGGGSPKCHVFLIGSDAPPVAFEVRGDNRPDPNTYPMWKQGGQVRALADGVILSGAPLPRKKWTTLLNNSTLEVGGWALRVEFPEI